MSTLGFPTYTPGTNSGATYSLNGVTYTWSGYAWYKTNQGPLNVTTLTGGTITIGTGTETINITGGNITIGGSSVLTTASLSAVTLQIVTTNGSTTTNTVTFSNGSNSYSTDSGSVQVIGGIGVSDDIWIGGTVYAEHVQIADAVFDSTTVPVPTSVPTLIDSYPVDQFRSSKYFIQIDDLSNSNFQVSELTLLVINTPIGFYDTRMSEYGTLQNGGTLGSFSSNINTNTNPNIVELYVTMNYSTDKTVKVLRTAMTP